MENPASGLQLNKDSTFRFYFSYGGLDRYGLVYCLVKKPGGDTVLNADKNGIIVVKDPINSKREK
jgi:hypothetical protein